mgnify:CR=1 FL=1
MMQMQNDLLKSHMFCHKQKLKLKNNKPENIIRDSRRKKTLIKTIWT